MIHFVDKVDKGPVRLIYIKSETAGPHGFVLSGTRGLSGDRDVSRALAWARKNDVPKNHLAALEKAVANSERVRARILPSALRALQPYTHAKQTVSPIAFDGLEFAHFPGIVITGKMMGPTWQLEISTASGTYHTVADSGAGITFALEDRARAAHAASGRAGSSPLSHTPALEAEADLRNERGVVAPKKKKGLSR